MKLSTLKHDHIIYKEPNGNLSNNIYCGRLTYKDKDKGAVEILDYSRTQPDALTDDYGWIILHQADSFEKLKELYPEFFI